MGGSARLRTRGALLLALAWVAAAPALGQDADAAPSAGAPTDFPRRPSMPSGGGDAADERSALEEDLDFEELERWIVLREEAAPPPPLVRLQVGPVLWVDVQSEIRADGGGVAGTQLDDLEQQQGLTASGASPWVELSIGRDLRGGADLLLLDRGGQPTVQETDVFFDGVHLARPGDLVDARFQMFTTSGYVEWDPLYGRTYRFGLLGGVRYFRLQASFRGARPGLSPQALTVRRTAELISPFFGGFVELTPFEYLTVSTRVQFMNWSWSDIGLKEARYLEFRLGGVVHVIPGILGVGADFRYFVIRAEGDDDDDDHRLEAGLAGSGVGLTLTLTF